MGELLSERTTPGVPEHVDLRLAERVAQFDEELRQPGHPQRLTILTRSADPRRVEHDQPAALAEPPRERPPRLEPGTDAVDEQQRLTGTGLGYPECRAGQGHTVRARLVALPEQLRGRQHDQPLP
jgi:hypothetical protein